MYTVTIHHTPQAADPLVVADATPEPVKVKVAEVTVAALDLPALMTLLYRKPRVRRADAGKPRAAK